MSTEAADRDLLEISEAIDRALHLATESERPQLDRLAERLEERRLRVLIAGEAKRGKSTLVNALVQRELLPTGVTPLTSVATTVSIAAPGAPEHATVGYRDGRTQEAELADLDRYVTESGNPENHLGVAGVTVHIHDPLLDRHAVDLVDTPGTGSVYEHNTTDAHEALRTLDAAVLVLSADPPMSAAEKDLLARISATSVETFVVLNKSDRLRADELVEAVDFTARVCTATIGRTVVVQPCSAHRGRSDPGFSRFVERLEDYLETRGAADLRRSLQSHLRRIVASMLDDARVRQRSFQLARQGSEQTSRELRARLVTIAAQREVIQDSCRGSVVRLRAELDEAAEEAGPTLAAECRHRLAAAWDDHLAAVPVEQLESEARSALAATVTAEVEQWRNRVTSRLESGLADLIAQADQAVSAQLRLARAAVQEALDIELSLDATAATLAVDPGFHYDYTVPMSWGAPMQVSMVRLRSTAHRRKRIRAAVLEEVARMTDRQLGRARADLQHRLLEAGHVLAGRLDRELEDTLGRLLAVLDQALDDARSAQQHDGLSRTLAGRVRSLEQLRARVV